MQEKIKVFQDSNFVYLGRTHRVKNAKVQDHKAMIFTDRQTFVKYETELDTFLTEIEFVEETSGIAKIVDSEKEMVRSEAIAEIKAKGEIIVSNVYHAEIMNANNRAMRISEKLESVFDAISDGEPDEKMIKKADAMVRLSNAIVSNEMTRFKYLNLKYPPMPK